MKTQVGFVLVCGLLAVMASCGSTTKIQWTDQVGDVSEDGVFQGDTADPEDGSDKDKYVIPDAPPGGWKYQIIFLNSSSGAIEVVADGTFALGVKVIDYANSSPAVSYPVTYEILDSQPNCSGEDCASLSAKEATTDTNGNALVTFVAGATADTLYTIRMSGDAAAPVIVEVAVKASPTGDLRIVFNPNVSADLAAVPNKIDVVYGTGFKQCSNFNPVSPWQDGIEGDVQVTSVASTPTFEGLDTEKYHWVYMVGWRGSPPNYQLVVYGCADNVKVGPKELVGPTTITVNVNTATLVPTGTYDMVSHFDFSDVATNLPGNAGMIMTYVEMIFYNPGMAMLEGIKAIVSAYIPAWVTDIAFGLFEDALANWINDWVFNEAPQPIKDFIKVGQDVLQIVNNLELTGQLKISKLSASCMNGKEYWSGITLYWKWGCPPNDDECGVYHFGLDDLNNTEFPLDILNGEWDGCVAGFDHLKIEPHIIQLSYGKLILFAINEMLIPAVTDYDDLNDMIYSIIDCQALAASMSSSILSGIGVSEQDLENFCNSALTTLLGPVVNSIGNLAAPSVLTLIGSGVLVDETGDLLVDRITEGEWSGQVKMDGQDVGAVTADFEAVRVQ